MIEDWRRRLIKSDFSAFIEEVFKTLNPSTPYLPGWHIELIAEYLQAIASSRVNRLIINLPPRSLKSICVSVAWPAWLLGNNPGCRIVNASYSLALSTKHSVDCRRIVQSDWYRSLFPNVSLAKDQNEKHKFSTTRHGFRLATSVGGTLTGEGGNFLIMDDPLNALQSLNRRRRDYVNQWFDHSFASRLDDKERGGIVLVMQRLHEEDLTGYLLSKGGWDELSLPAMFTGKQQFDFGRVRKTCGPGELLHGARENQTHITRAKIELGSSAFCAQYLQQPLREEGGMLRAGWFERYGETPQSFARIVQSWDTAIKASANHDASACLTFGEASNKSYLIDVRVLRLEYPELKKMVCALASQWRPDAILIEDKASGQQLIQDLQRQSSMAIVPIRPKNDKVTRFAAISALCEAGRIVLPKQALWLSEFEQELFSFPNVAHDDQADAFSQYLDWLNRQNYIMPRIRRF